MSQAQFYDPNFELDKSVPTDYPLVREGLLWESSRTRQKLLALGSRSSLIKEVKNMKIFQGLQNIFQYLADGVAKLFQPTNDDYPEIGVQPFEGEPYDEKEQNY